MALGQTYFAVQTRRQEEADQLASLTEDQKRLYLRGQLSDHNRHLAVAASQAGVIAGRFKSPRLARKLASYEVFVFISATEAGG